MGCGVVGGLRLLRMVCRDTVGMGVAGLPNPDKSITIGLGVVSKRLVPGLGMLFKFIPGVGPGVDGAGLGVTGLLV